MDIAVKRAQRELQEVRAQAKLALEVAHDVALPAKLLAFMSWLELHPPAKGGPLVSIVLATRDRPGPLARAIDSVVEQRYRSWELIVVDDGTVPETRSVVEGAGDERVRLVEGPRSGLSAARNAGLASATGEVVCYCDDDNVMHPGWLHAVAQVFAERADVEVAYGVSIAEHRLPGELAPEGWWPSFWQLPWSRQTLLEENVTDTGSLAHRNGLEEARFDERVTTAEDWDLLLRLTENREALAIPAISHAYTMRGPGRMSEAADYPSGLVELRHRYAGS
jgi:glycosyltransferase involved in cell wall biosynthesis